MTEHDFQLLLDRIDRATAAVALLTSRMDAVEAAELAKVETRSLWSARRAAQ